MAQHILPTAASLQGMWNKHSACKFPSAGLWGSIERLSTKPHLKNFPRFSVFSHPSPWTFFFLFWDKCLQLWDNMKFDRITDEIETNIKSVSWLGLKVWSLSTKVPLHSPDFVAQHLGHKGGPPSASTLSHCFPVLLVSTDHRLHLGPQSGES